MRKVLLIILMVCLADSVFAQTKDTSEQSKVQFTLDTVALKRGYEYRVLDEEECWQLLADSVTALGRTGKIPAFILDPCFDWEGSPRCWRTFHSTTSVRWEVLSRVKSKVALERLIEKAPALIKQKCKKVWKGSSYPGDLTPDLNGYSTYDLIVKRIRQF